MDSSSPDVSSGRVRSLPVLRAMIDAVDHDILRLVARRYGLIAEVAEYKREHRRPIRDVQREKEIIADRRSRAVPLGLSPDMIESLFRLLLWGSRDRQAALRAEVPADIEPRTVAIIGGKGGMGRCLAGLFGDLGLPVMIADLDTQLTPEEAAATADVVVISVPIDVTEQVIRRIGPLVRPEALLMDVTSIKSGPVQVMLESTAASVIGAHPLFGPSVHSLQGQRVVLCPARPGSWLDWVRRMLQARGLVVKEATAEQHDQAMSIVQVLVHFSTEVMGNTLAHLGVSIRETLEFTSPVYLMELLMTARHFSQSPQLYATIEMTNPSTPQVTEIYAKAAQQMHNLVNAKDHAAFEAMFRVVREYFGDFTEFAQERSSFLIDRLVERA